MHLFHLLKSYTGELGYDGPSGTRKIGPSYAYYGLSLSYMQVCMLLYWGPHLIGIKVRRGIFFLPGWTFVIHVFVCYANYQTERTGGACAFVQLYVYIFIFILTHYGSVHFAKNCIMLRVDLFLHCSRREVKLPVDH